MAAKERLGMKIVSYVVAGFIAFYAGFFLGQKNGISRTIKNIDIAIDSVIEQKYNELWNLYELKERYMYPLPPPKEPKLFIES